MERKVVRIETGTGEVVTYTVTLTKSRIVATMMIDRKMTKTYSLSIKHPDAADIVQSFARAYDDTPEVANLYYEIAGIIDLETTCQEL